RLWTATLQKYVFPGSVPERVLTSPQFFDVLGVVNAASVAYWIATSSMVAAPTTGSSHLATKTPAPPVTLRLCTGPGITSSRAARTRTAFVECVPFPPLRQ